MARWPVVDPSKPKLRTNIGGPNPLKPPTEGSFDGPLNVLIALQGAAQGAVETSKTKEAYDQIPVTMPPIALDDDDDTLADG